MTPGTGPAPGKTWRVGTLWAVIGAALLVAWLMGLIWFAETLPRAAHAPRTATDAVVVLTGGADRLKVGIDILARGRARKLFVSGVYRGVDVAQILALVKKQGEELDCCMVLGHTADNTRGNAAETARWMKKEGFRSLRLVTANYHMRRSRLEFGRVMPKVLIVPHPVFPRGFKADRWWIWPVTLRLVVSEYIKYLVALTRFW
jgi:uncharacterized SAM-binding protein YcdF (DUF218 family)